MAAHLLERQRRGEEAERGGGAGGRRDQHLGDAEDAGDAGGVRGAGAAEADHGVAARVPALLHDVDARGGGHALGDDAVDAPRRLNWREAEAAADRGERALGGGAIERHAAAEEEGGIVVAEQQVSVGNGGLGAAAAVAGGAGIGAGGMRADAQQADLVDGGDGAAAGADLDHVDDRRLDRQAGTALEAVHARGFHFRGDGGAAILDQARLSRWCRPCRS